MQHARLDVQRRFSNIKQGQSIHLQELVTTKDLKRYAVCLHVFSSLVGFLCFRKISISLCFNIGAQATGVHERKIMPMHKIRIIV